MAIFGGGAVLAGLVLGAIAVFVIDREFTRAIAYSLVAAGLAFVGLINAAQIIVRSDRERFATERVSLGYLFMAVVFWSSRRGTPASSTPRTSGGR